MTLSFILLVVAFLILTLVCLWLMHKLRLVERDYRKIFDEQFKKQKRLQSEIMELSGEIAGKDAAITLLHSKRFMTQEADDWSYICKDRLQQAIMMIQRRKMGMLLPGVLSDDLTVTTPGETVEELDEKIRSMVEESKAANDCMRKEMKL